MDILRKFEAIASAATESAGGGSRAELLGSLRSIFSDDETSGDRSSDEGVVALCSSSCGAHTKTDTNKDKAPGTDGVRGGSAA